ncbi:hypothetical protein C1280_32285 [Gemmata obscuriglobus]|uniref:Uncharacterized protein n=1 Tax=Gemmata obscuriglobus TaxID=114 RepID=A0A2Z3H9X0_9BACT|nr:hypothetical protein C1280_32285 [Gemmata obscuriglobus]
MSRQTDRRGHEPGHRQESHDSIHQGELENRYLVISEREFLAGDLLDRAVNEVFRIAYCQPFLELPVQAVKRVEPLL